MNLHRSLTADWISVPESERTWLQTIAAKSNGALTLSNGITLLGLLLVCIGLKDILDGRLTAGIILVAFGRLADLADGFVADVTKTKSPVGETFDATVDKIALFLSIVVLFATDYVSRWFVGLLLLHVLVNVAIFFVAREKRVRLHPTLAGKLAAGAAWVATGLIALSNINDPHSLKPIAYAGGIVTGAVFVVLAVVCAAQYGKQLQNG